MASQEIQKKAKAYLEKHQIEEILGDIITTLSHHQIKNPIIYIIKYLATVHCSSKELQDAGIKIDSKDKIEAPVLCLPFPNFTQHQGSIKKMTKEQFYGCKNKITDQGNNFRSICKLIAENPKSKPGLFAVDPSSYQIYSDLFEPIIKEKGYLNPPTKELSYILNSTILDDVRPYLEESIFVLRRNIPRQRFGSTMQNRQSLTKELQQVLTQQALINYTLSYDLTALASDDVRRLQINDKLYKKKDTNQPTIQHIFKDSRHPDWPNDRLLLQSADKQNIVWINREDHLKFKFLQTEKSSILDSIDQCCKMNQFLDSKGLVSFDDKFGFHTVKPQFSGLGLTFTLKFKLDPQSINKIKANSNNLSQKIQNRVMNIQTKEKDKHFTIKSERCTGLSMKQYIEQLCTILTILFEGVIKKPDTLYVERQFGVEHQQQQSPLKTQPDKQDQENVVSPKKQSSVSTGHVAIDILQNTTQEELDYYSFHKLRLEQKKTQEKIYSQTLDKLVSDLSEDTFYSQSTNKKFVIVRRNLSQRKSNLEEIIKLNYEVGQDSILKECNLQSSSHKGILKYFHHQLEFYVVLNLDDDFTFIFPIVKISLSQQLHKIQKIVDGFITKEYKYAWNKQLGYLTNKNEHLGSGVTLIYDFPKIVETEIQNILNEQTKGQCNSVLNSAQFVYVNSLNDVNIQIFRNVIHTILLKQKNKQKQKKKVVNNQIHELDCYKGDQLWAPSYECFQTFEDLYAQYIQKEAIEVFNGKNIAPRKNHTKIDPNDITVDLPSNSPISNIKCTFYRNIKNVKYLHEMSYSEKLIFKVLLLIFKAKYKHLIRQFGIQLGKNHHIEITFESQVQEFKDKYIQNWNLLEELDKEIGFQSEGNFGFKGPVLNEVLLEGFQLEITSAKPINLDLIKTFNYKAVSIQDQILQKDEPIKKIQSNRPCLFDSELKLIRDIQ